MAERLSRIEIGTAGWSIPAREIEAFAPGPSRLARYASRFTAVEINSSFYRPHRPSTYARWAASVPDRFRFSVKMPKEITHERRLADSAGPLERFLDEAGELQAKLGPLLVQLPPSLAFAAEVVTAFLDMLRTRFDGTVACEPRHASWFGPEADEALLRFRIARVAADPARVPQAAVPGGWPGLAYYRLHGSPRIYYSGYGPERQVDIAASLSEQAARGTETWCMFDNTTLGEATTDALAVRRRLSHDG